MQASERQIRDPVLVPDLSSHDPDLHRLHQESLCLLGTCVDVFSSCPYDGHPILPNQQRSKGIATLRSFPFLYFYFFVFSLFLLKEFLFFFFLIGITGSHIGAILFGGIFDIHVYRCITRIH